MTETEKRAARVAEERAKWWQLAETYARCVAIARDEWEAELAAATAEQYALAVIMRDRVREGIRATGAKFEMDYGIPTPLFTPRDKVQFLKETSVTLFIEACKKSLPVTPEGKRAAQTADEKGDTVEAGSAADETDGDREQESLAQAGELVEALERITHKTTGVIIPEASAS